MDWYVVASPAIFAVAAGTTALLTTGIIACRRGSKGTGRGSRQGDTTTARPYVVEHPDHGGQEVTFVETCAKFTANEFAAAKASVEDAETDAVKKVWKDAANATAPPPALPVLTKRQLSRLNRSLGTPLKQKLLLRMGGADRRTLTDAAHDLYVASRLDFHQFAERVESVLCAGL